jgi:hypothetical protein
LVPPCYAKLDTLTIDPVASWRARCWSHVHKQTWKTPPREIALRRLSRARALGISYRLYTLELLERGVYQ